jgi:hypothetical protein
MKHPLTVCAVQGTFICWTSWHSASRRHPCAASAWRPSLECLRPAVYQRQQNSIKLRLVHHQSSSHQPTNSDSLNRPVTFPPLYARSSLVFASSLASSARRFIVFSLPRTCTHNLPMTTEYTREIINTNLSAFRSTYVKHTIVGIPRKQLKAGELWPKS